MDSLKEKYEKLISQLKGLGRAAVAFSGGVDSTFLLNTARDALGGNVIAITGRFISFPEWESAEAGSFCRSLGIEQIVLNLDQMSIEGFCDNPPDRCYICKKALFKAFIETAAEKGFPYVAEGTNADDTSDYRPGLKAIKELGILSPLKDAGLTKDEIRILSKEQRLPTWDKPSLACLATRFPYGEKITKEKILSVSEAEKLLFGLGFRQVRVRMHGNIARIEIDPEQFGMILDPEIRESVNRRLSELGFLYVTLDLKGYKTGSMNLEIL